MNTYTENGNVYLKAPCACDECRAGMRGELTRPWGQGHFLCQAIPEEVLRMEDRGEIFAVYENGWRWQVTLPESG